MSKKEKSMNNYIKKNLIIYLSLVLILFGMASASYAITATDADAYVTRSEYATKMSELQLMLDETESSLLGKINRYRSTDIKFVTFDSPDKYCTNNDYGGGYHTGGNFMPRRKLDTSNSTWGGYWGVYQYGNQQIANTANAQYKSYNLHRLWNGDYYICNGMTWRSSTDTSVTDAYYYIASSNCAIPVENLPGWYLVVLIMGERDTFTEAFFSLVKLDPTVPYISDAEIRSKELVIRLKKDLWTYVSSKTVKITENKTTINKDLVTYHNQSYISPLSHSYYSNATTTTTNGVACSGWIDKETGDYMISYKNFPPTSPTNGNRVLKYNSGTDVMITRFIPVDNVEYMGGPGCIHEYATGIAMTYPGYLPDARYIGTGQQNDPYYEYEFVDCVNGIKYWHAYKKPGNEKLGTGTPNIFGIHYSLPIVY